MILRDNLDSLCFPIIILLSLVKDDVVYMAYTFSSNLHHTKGHSHIYPSSDCVLVKLIARTIILAYALNPVDYNGIYYDVIAFSITLCGVLSKVIE